MADRFKLVFLSVILLTVVCGLLMGAIAIFSPQPLSSQVSAVFETLKYVFTMGMLTVFSFLGLKNHSPPNEQ